MEKIYEVNNPEVVLKQLKKYYGNEVDLYLSTSKNKKYMVFDENGKKIILGIWGMLIIPKPYIRKKEWIILKEQVISKVNGNKIYLVLTCWVLFYYGMGMII